MKKLKWFLIIGIIIVGTFYYKVSDNASTVGTVCFANEIKKTQKGDKYYLYLSTTKEKVRCTKEEYNKIRNGQKELYYGIEYKKNVFLTKYLKYEPKLTWIQEKKVE